MISICALGVCTASAAVFGDAAAAADDTTVLLGDPPRASDALLQFFLPVPQGGAESERSKANQSSLTRAQVVALYNTLYVPGNSVAMGWTGSPSPTCIAGTTSAAYRQTILDRVNFYRQLAGLPTVGMFGDAAAQTGNAQASALMQGNNPWDGSANPHSPPPSWNCYTAGGALAAGKSNLAWGAAGPSAIRLYMDDYGTGNAPVGHRRWLLYPPLANVGTGDVNGGTPANDLWVLANGSDGTWGTRPAMPNGVAWPPGGYVPYQVLPSVSNRWSFSWPGANMTAATVTITKNGQPIAILGYDARDNAGYGDASVVFRPDNSGAVAVSYASPGAVDQDYVVTVSGMTGSGVPSSVTYTVTVIDPSITPPPTISGTISNGATAVSGVSFCAQPSAGVSCTVSNASGAYSCTVPNGWSGVLHSPMVGGQRIPAQVFANVTGAVTRNVAATTGVPSCDLDVDNNGLFEAATDGLAILRRALGFGQASFAGLSGACAANTTAASIHGAANTSFNAGGYNVTGGGATLATTDALVIIRTLLGLSGNAVVDGLGLSSKPGVVRTSWNDVKTWMNSNCRAGL
ncbi:MAG: CAP domain-containing protein [Burkholderiales bacterium]|nr:CAP domain-containing protein [Burkholderiales bacterium]